MPFKISQKPEVITRLENDESQSVVTASYNTGSSTIYNIITTMIIIIIIIFLVIQKSTKGSYTFIK